VREIRSQVFFVLRFWALAPLFCSVSIYAMSATLDQKPGGLRFSGGHSGGGALIFAIKLLLVFL